MSFTLTMLRPCLSIRSHSKSTLPFARGPCLIMPRPSCCASTCSPCFNVTLVVAVVVVVGPVVAVGGPDDDEGPRVVVVVGSCISTSLSSAVTVAAICCSSTAAAAAVTSPFVLLPPPRTKLRRFAAGAFCVFPRFFPAHMAGGTERAASPRPRPRAEPRLRRNDCARNIVFLSTVLTSYLPITAKLPSAVVPTLYRGLTRITSGIKKISQKL